MHIRHASRHVQESVSSMLVNFLAEYDWTGDTPPYGAKPFTVQLRQPEGSDLQAVEANTVFIGFGDETSARDRQLGGGLLEREFVLFVDIFGEKQTIALACASDIKDRLEGLFGGTAYLRPTDQATGLPLPGYVGEFEDVVRDVGTGSKVAWQTVKATLTLTFPGGGE